MFATKMGYSDICINEFCSKTIGFFIVIEMITSFNVERAGLHVAR